MEKQQRQEAFYVCRTIIRIVDLLYSSAVFCMRRFFLGSEGWRWSKKISLEKKSTHVVVAQ
jgi:hypothetical protein